MENIYVKKVTILILGRYNDIVTFYRLIGFVQEYKTNNLKTLILERAPKIVSIKDNGVHKVYDFTEPETHWGIVNDSVVHNCAEYLAGNHLLVIILQLGSL